jgi:hypothetical protein
VSILGLVWGGAMLVNFAWPRGESNPTPKETGLALNFHSGWLNGPPVLWTVLVVIALVGAIYFVLVQRKKPAHLRALEGGEARRAARCDHDLGTD